jgi:DNA-binding NarL/FixJ family response regulator
VVRRDRAFDDLPGAIEAAARGEPTIGSGRLARLLSRRNARGSSSLTRRELEVLALMAEGMSNEAIAERLFISLNTTRNHVQRILTKFSAHSRLEAVTEAWRRHLLPSRM